MRGATSCPSEGRCPLTAPEPELLWSPQGDLALTRVESPNHPPTQQAEVSILLSFGGLGGGGLVSTRPSTQKVPADSVLQLLGFHMQAKRTSYSKVTLLFLSGMTTHLTSPSGARLGIAAGQQVPGSDVLTKWPCSPTPARPPCIPHSPSCF